MPMPAPPGSNRRLVAVVLSAAIHLAALAALLLWHFAPEPGARDAPMIVVELPEDRPSNQPEPTPKPEAKPEAAPPGAPAPAGPRAEAAPLAMALPATLPTLPASVLPGTGTAVSSGAADAGSGTGAGGTGNGTGGGGDGAGGGARDREGTDPVIVRGDFRQSDYPKELRATGPKGVTWAEVVVGVNGRVTSCRITKPSGIPQFDAKTCQILFQRFRYRPARDAAGRPVAAPDSFSVDWDYQDLTEEDAP